jgi:excinuclease UvrABC nuclease subunit
MSESATTASTLDLLQSLPTIESSLDNPPALPGVYLLFDVQDNPLYIGHSHNIRKRLQTHKRTKKWWKQVWELHCITDIPDEDGRLTRETIEILRHRPRYNQIVYLGLTKDGRIYPARFR